MTLRIHSLLALATVILATTYVVPASAQVVTGTPPFGSYVGGPDVINLANLNSHIDIPILHKLGRGIQFNFDLTYDSSIWTPVTSGSTQSWQPTGSWGWTNSLFMVGYLIKSTQVIDGTCTMSNGRPGRTITVNVYFTYVDGLGTPHPFPGHWGSYQNTCTGQNYTISGSSATADGSAYTINVTGGTVNQLNDAAGHIINAPVNSSLGAATTTDRNGNEISATSGGVYTDSLGQTALTITGGPPPTAVKYTYTTPSGGSASYQVNYTNYTVATNFSVSGITEYKSSAAVPLVTSIGLPDGSQYSFQYESTPGTCTPYSGTTCTTARLTSVTLPTGGMISYAYYNNNNNFPACTTGKNGIFSDGSASCLQRATPDGTWTYVRSQVSGTEWQTLVTDPSAAANQTLIYFQKDSNTTSPTNNFYETLRQVYQGSASGTPLRQWTTCYNTNTTNCSTTAVRSPIGQRNVTDQYGSSGLQCQHNYFYNSNGTLAEQDDYDYGSGSPGSLLRKTLIKYAPLPPNITAFKQTVTICNGTGSSSSCAGPSGGNAGTVVSQTNYNYDETTPSPTSVAQHTSVSGSRGNLTSINYPVSGLTSHFTYYDTGSPNTSQDVNGATTTYNYSSNTADCQMAFPTSISAPLSMSTSMTWNCIGGVLTSVTDENNQVSSVTYNDAFYWRPNGVTDQLGNQTGIWYQPNPSYCCPWMVASALSFNNGSSVVEDVQYEDGLGRTYVDQHPQSPSSSTLDSVSYTFDSNGRPYSVSMPCSIGFAGTCTTPKTTQTYDALNRPLVTTDGGGGTSTDSYSQNDVLVTIGPAPSGEHAKQRQLEYDALGRLTSVCEITTLAGSGSCGQNTSASGYLTKYTYDALGNVLNVTQNAQQTRTYAYDAMSRLTSEANPESGTTTYSYDAPTSNCSNSSWNANMPGYLVQRQDANGNVTCFLNDQLGRITNIYVASGPAQWATTGCKVFVYDTAGLPNNGPPLPSGANPVNLKGRLAEAFTTDCNYPRQWPNDFRTDEWLSYTARGETSDIYEYTPHSGAYYHSSATYWANGVLNYLSGAAGSTGTYGAGWNVDGEGRVSSNYNTGNNPLSGTTYNSASQPTQISFSSGDSDSFNYDPNTGRMTQYQFNLNGQQVDTGALTWNSNGTLQMLAISDGLNGADTQACNYQHDDLVRIANVNCSGNQLQNPGFESGGANWSLGSSWSVVNNAANAQSGSWYLYGSSTYNASWAVATPNGTNWIPVTPGEVLTFGGWVKRVGGTGVLDWGCEIVDANHNLAAWCGAGGGPGDGNGGTGWTLYSVQITVPANGAYVQFFGEIHGWGDTDTSLTSGYFDSAFLEGAPAWSQSFSYDAFGNINKSGSMSFTPFYSSATNRITSFPGGCTASYDNNGNVLNDCLHSYSWDADGHAVTVDGVGLTYDALGRMVEQNRSGAYTQFVYSPNGFKMQIMNGQTPVKDFVPLVGGVTAVYADTIYFRHPDWLGSSRFVSAYNRTMHSDTAYAPFGEPYAQAGATDLSFTGMNQDTVSGLYDFPAREYSTQGRWPSPDPAGLAAVDPTNPQSWNRYAYVLNNPLSNIDPRGLYCVYLNDAGDGVESIDDNSSSGDCGESGGYWIAGEYGGASQISINGDLGLVSGYGYLDGSWQYSVAGAMDSNAWGAWTQTAGPGITADTFAFSTGALQYGAYQGERLIKSLLPTTCGGGGFIYAGFAGKYKGAEGFAGYLGEYDTKTGWSNNGLFEGGGEHLSGGVSANSKGFEPLVFVPILEAAGLVLGPGGVGFYVGTARYGGGAYVNVTSMQSCEGR